MIDAGDPRHLQSRLLGSYSAAAAPGQAPFSHSTASAFTPTPLQPPSFGTAYAAPAQQPPPAPHAAGYRPPDPRMQGGAAAPAAPAQQQPVYGGVASAAAAPVAQVDLFAILQNAGVRPLAAGAPNQAAHQPPYIPSLAGEDLLGAVPTGNGSAAAAGYSGGGAYSGGYGDRELGAFAGDNGPASYQHSVHDAWRPTEQQLPAAASMQQQPEQDDSGAKNIGAQLLNLLSKFGS